MPIAPQDDRPPMVIAMHWVNTVMSIALLMVLPAGLGYWLDGRWRTAPWLVSCGAILGFAAGMWQLFAMAKKSAAQHGRSGSPERPKQD